jgi:hypothetical protein
MPRADGSKIPKKSLRNLPPQATLPRVKFTEAAQSRPRSRPSSRRVPPRRPPAAEVVSTWALLVIDSQPLRKKAQRDYQRAVRELDAAKADSERFHAQDKPLFAQWLSANFGALLTEMRDLQARLSDAQNLVDEVQQEYFYGGHRSVHSAYRAVMNRRNNPEPAPEPEPRESEEPPGRDQADEDDFHRAAEDFWDRFHQADAAPRSQPERHSQNQRLKELYRKLARRLHPDNGRTITPRESELWLQTQTAYENGQVEVLENILNLLEIDEKGSKNASVSTLLRLTASLKATLRALKSQITGLRQNLAWNFSRRTDRDELLRRTSDSLNADREKLVWLLTKYEAQIQRWELEASGRKRRVPSRRAGWTDEEWV